MTAKKTAKSSGRPPGRPRPGDKMAKINTAAHILQHARGLFARKGFSAVSIHDIVSAAEISKPTLYYYFPDKEQLYAAVLGELIETAGLAFGTLNHDEAPLEERLLRLAEGFFEHAPVSMPCLIRDVSQNLGEARARQVLDLYRARIFEPVRDLFATAIGDGRLYPHHDPALLGEFFLTLLDWLTLRYSFHESSPLDNREKAAQLVRLFLDGASTLKPTP